MTNRLSQHWWILAVRGAIAVIIGIIAFAWPGITVAILVGLFGAYALIDGIFALATAFRLSHPDERWWALIAEGVLGLIIAAIAFFDPIALAKGVVFVISFWATVTGLLEILAAFQLRKVIENEWMLGLTGVLSIMLGIAMSVAPGTALRVYVYLIGAYIFLAGALLIGLSLNLRKLTPAAQQ